MDKCMRCDAPVRYRGAYLCETCVNNLANGPLIAAAPDLLEACKDATVLASLVRKAEWISRHGDDLRTDAYDENVDEIEQQIATIETRIHAAIAKAQGQAPDA